LIDWKTILVIEYPLISHWMGLSLIDMGWRGPLFTSKEFLGKYFHLNKLAIQE
jgi:hypothetical protein